MKKLRIVLATLLAAITIPVIAVTTADPAAAVNYRGQVYNNGPVSIWIKRDPDYTARNLPPYRWSTDYYYDTAGYAIPSGYCGNVKYAGGSTYPIKASTWYWVNSTAKVTVTTWRC